MGCMSYPHSMFYPRPPFGLVASVPRSFSRSLRAPPYWHVRGFVLEPTGKGKREDKDKDKGKYYHKKGRLPNSYPVPAPPFKFIGPKNYRSNIEDVHLRPREHDPSWAESACTGKRKAVIIGINYTLGAAPLRGCHSDADRMRRFIIQRYGFDSDDIRLFKDDPRLKQYQQPTKENIIKALEWLVDGAKTDDSLFFFFSGHGGQMYDIDGDEPDAMDECIYPVDAATAGPILDDHLHKILVRPLPRGARLTAIFDSCHSGSALDLPFFYSASQQMRDPRILDVGQGTVVRIASDIRHDGDKDSRVSGDDDFQWFGKYGLWVKKMEGAGWGRRHSEADVIMLSGCKDSQFSFDAMVDDRYTGALSWAFTSTLDDYPQITYGQLLNQVRDKLKKKGYNQRPQLSTSHPMDLDLVFIA